MKLPARRRRRPITQALVGFALLACMGVAGYTVGWLAAWGVGALGVLAALFGFVPGYFDWGAPPDETDTTRPDVDFRS